MSISPISCGSWPGRLELDPDRDGEAARRVGPAGENGRQRFERGMQDRVGREGRDAKRIRRDVPWAAQRNGDDRCARAGKRLNELDLSRLAMSVYRADDHGP